MTNPINKYEGFRSANGEAVQKLQSLNPLLPPFLLSAARTHSLRLPTIIVFVVSLSLSLFIYIYTHILRHILTCECISTPISLVFLFIHFTTLFHSSAAVAVARARATFLFLKVLSIYISSLFELNVMLFCNGLEFFSVLALLCVVYVRSLN